MKDENDNPYIYSDIESHFYSAISSKQYIEKTLEYSRDLFETKLVKLFDKDETNVILSQIIPLFIKMFSIYVHFYRVYVSYILFII